MNGFVLNPMLNPNIMEKERFMIILLIHPVVMVVTFIAIVELDGKLSNEYWMIDCQVKQILRNRIKMFV